MTAEPPSRPLREVVSLFLRLGFLAFGGPAAHIALMEAEVVRRLKWLDHEQFLDLLGLANLLPGPSSTELAIFLGYRRAGWRGLVAAGVCFIAPAMLMVLALAWAYVRFGTLPAAQGLLYGVKPVIIVIVLQALWNLGRKAAKTRLLIGIGSLACLLTVRGGFELPVLFGAGLLHGVLRWTCLKPRLSPRPLGVMLLVAGLFVAVPLLIAKVTLVTGQATPGSLFVVFTKVGATLYGSGYVLLAFLRGDLITRLHWLSSGQLLDATAVGQVTPGPVFTTATFIGYLLSGWRGAVAATVGIFAPGFVYVAAAGPLVRRLRESPLAGAFMDGLNAAAIGLMAAVTIQLGQAALVDAMTWIIAAGAAELVFLFEVNSVWVVLGGALVGLMVGGAG
jgi:chromate transporter